MENRSDNVPESNLKDRLRGLDQADLGSLIGSPDEAAPFGNAFPNRFTKGINRPIWKKQDGEGS
jgi:hypothetical protein